MWSFLAYGLPRSQCLRPSSARRRNRRVFVVVPPGVRVGDTLQTTTPENIVLNVRVPPRTEPGARICVQY